LSKSDRDASRADLSLFPEESRWIWLALRVPRQTRYALASTDGDAEENNGENDIWLIKTDSQGNLLWQGAYGGSNLEYGFDAVENEDKSILLVGESTSNDFGNLINKGLSDVLIIKIR